MDQRRFEKTFRQIVTRLNGCGGDGKSPESLRPVPVVSQASRDAQAARQSRRRRDG